MLDAKSKVSGRWKRGRLLKRGNCGVGESPFQPDQISLRIYVSLYVSLTTWDSDISRAKSILITGPCCK